MAASPCGQGRQASAIPRCARLVGLSAPGACRGREPAKSRRLPAPRSPVSGPGGCGPDVGLVHERTVCLRLLPREGRASGCCSTPTIPRWRSWRAPRAPPARCGASNGPCCAGNRLWRGRRPAGFRRPRHRAAAARTTCGDGWPNPGGPRCPPAACCWDFNPAGCRARLPSKSAAARPYRGAGGPLTSATSAAPWPSASTSAHPRAGGIAGAVHHRVDEVLGLVFRFGRRGWQRPFPARPDQRVFPHPAQHHHHGQHGERWRRHGEHHWNPSQMTKRHSGQQEGHARVAPGVRSGNSCVSWTAPVRRNPAR